MPSRLPASAPPARVPAGAQFAPAGAARKRRVAAARAAVLGTNPCDCGGLHKLVRALEAPRARRAERRQAVPIGRARCAREASAHHASRVRSRPVGARRGLGGEPRSGTNGPWAVTAHSPWGHYWGLSMSFGTLSESASVGGKGTARKADRQAHSGGAAALLARSLQSSGSHG
jgi:hypothetical protein